jgi:putative ABC transport system substrate-binding protein
MGRRSFLRTLAGGLLTAPLAAGARQTGNLPRVGYLSNSARYGDPDTGFFAGLREHGYEPDRNILVEARYSAGRPDRVSEFAADLVRLRCRLIEAWGPPVVTEITRLTASIPIIAISSTDFVVLGWAATFARPGGNITGFMLDAGELNAKRFELLKEVVPTLANATWKRSGPRRSDACGAHSETQDGTLHRFRPGAIRARFRADGATPDRWAPRASRHDALRLPH